MSEDSGGFDTRIEIIAANITVVDTNIVIGYFKTMSKKYCMFPLETIVM